MVRWRRRRARDDHTRTAAQDSGTSGPTKITGVTIDPRHDLASGGTGLYEFWTDQGVPVRLHDMDLISVELRPLDRALVLRFEYTERRWTPAEATATPVVAMRFAGIAIRQWAQEDAAPVEALGQVEEFEYDGERSFRLTTYSAVMDFTATRLAIVSEARR